MRIKRNKLDVIKEGIYINIYYEFIPVDEENIGNSCSKMIPLYEFLQQLDGISTIFPELICPVYTIKLFNPRNPKIPSFDISNEHTEYIGPSTLDEIVIGVKESINHLNSIKSNDALYYNVQWCDILGMNPNNKTKTNIKRKSLSKSIRHEVFKRDGYKCLECGAGKEDTVLHIDHIVPVSQGGSDELSNLQTLCEACNLGKSNRAWKG